MIEIEEKALRYRLEPLTSEEAARWDELIAPYDTTELFHHRAWLDYLAASRDVDMRLWGLLEDGRTVGYFCGGLLRKGPFRVLGSPLKGWGTNLMGPVVNRDIDQVEFLRALRVMASGERLAMVELEQRVVAEPHLLEAGFTPVSAWTYVVNLQADHDRMWASLEASRRTGIRKAIKAKLTVQEADDPGIVEEFYDQYREVMARKGLVPPYSRECARLLFHHLKKSDMLLAMRVHDENGLVIATGLFPHDGRTVYFWGGASRTEGYRLCANDLLQWTVMCRAADLGIRLYDMSGHGPFKRKFGGELVEVKRWHRSYWRTARWGRRAYELYFQKRNRVEGWWRRRGPGSETEES
jgi:hypothetical protein